MTKKQLAKRLDLNWDFAKRVETIPDYTSLENALAFLDPTCTEEGLHGDDADAIYAVEHLSNWIVYGALVDKYGNKIPNEEVDYSYFEDFDFEFVSLRDLYDEVLLNIDNAKMGYYDFMEPEDRDIMGINMESNEFREKDERNTMVRTKVYSDDMYDVYFAKGREYWPDGKSYTEYHDDYYAISKGLAEKYKIRLHFDFRNMPPIYHYAWVIWIKTFYRESDIPSITQYVKALNKAKESAEKIAEKIKGHLINP